jgi:hypothetical protein
MNSNVDVAAPELSLAETWNRQAEDAQPLSVFNNKAESPREMVALFPAGRFFRFPVSVRIQIAPESDVRHPDGDPAPNACKDLGRVVVASIGNARCVEPEECTPEVFFFGDVVVDFRKLELHRCGQRLRATMQEFKTLHYFLMHPEVAISREELLNNVWGFHQYPTTRTVDNRIMRLRKKLENNPAKPVHLLTVHGLGYKFVP